MTEKGRVKEINGKLVIVAPDTGAACFGCMNHECKANGGLITAGNPNALPLEIGKMVEVAAPGAGLIGQAFAALLPPILGFIASYYLASLLFPGAGEGAAALIGVFFLFASAFVIYRARKKSFANGEFTITRIIG